MSINDIVAPNKTPNTAPAPPLPQVGSVNSTPQPNTMPSPLPSPPAPAAPVTEASPPAAQPAPTEVKPATSQPTTTTTAPPKPEPATVSATASTPIPNLQPATVATNSPTNAPSPDSVKLLIQQELSRQPSEFSIVRLIDLLITYASVTHASDIHIDPDSDQLNIRFRIDGILEKEFVLPKIVQSVLVSRIKILSGLRTDEHQAPQDGRFKLLLKDAGTVDVRVSIVPTYYGENVEMRLLQSPSAKLQLEDLDFSSTDLAKIKHAIASPYGMILATGPTGSGKTTMLYTILKTLNTSEVSIITIEDPIEYSIGGIVQIPVSAQTGLTFAAGLRSILRQDPNIVMVGEIRDQETAEIGVNAALTGHLLLSTLHTNDAATTLARLTEFKIEPFLIASTVNVAIGQRLVRKLCQACKIPKVISDVEYQSLLESIPADLLGNNRQFYVAQGCDVCNHTGYTGRTGIYEVLVVDDQIRTAIMKRGNASEIAQLAMQSGMTTMLQDGIRKAIEGKTTLEEVLRVVHE